MFTIVIFEKGLPRTFTVHNALQAYNFVCLRIAELFSNDEMAEICRKAAIGKIANLMVDKEKYPQARIAGCYITAGAVVNQVRKCMGFPKDKDVMPEIIEIPFIG